MDAIAEKQGWWSVLAPAATPSSAKAKEERIEPLQMVVPGPLALEKREVAACETMQVGSKSLLRKMGATTGITMG